MVRKIFAFVLGLGFLAGAIFVAKNLIDSNKRPVREVPKTVKTVYTQTVNNTEIPIILKSNGNLVAARKIELFSEVQGIFEESRFPFKAGQRYNKGAVLLDINSR